MSTLGKMSTKVNLMFKLLSSLRIDIQEIKESLIIMTRSKQEEGAKLPVNFSLKSLSNNNDLKFFLKATENKHTYVS